MAVRDALRENWADVPFRAVLFVAVAEWPLPRKPANIGGVTVVWLRGMGEVLPWPGPITSAAIATVSSEIEAARQPAG